MELIYKEQLSTAIIFSYSSFSADNHFPDINLQLQNGMYDSQVLPDEVGKVLPRWPFYVDGVWEVMVPVMKYTSEFPFAYIPRLQALALEYPLDVSTIIFLIFTKYFVKFYLNCVNSATSCFSAILDF